MLTVRDIIEATGGVLLKGGAGEKGKGICIDSRTLKKGEIFVAIKGENFDGHRFIPQAVSAGAEIVVTHKDIVPKDARAVIRVQDTVEALGLIARSVRLRSKVCVIAVTGSTGKTTVKNLTASVLKQKYRVLSSEKSFNNHIGVPLTLLNLKPRYQIAVLELGSNCPGDIEWLAKISVPDVAVFTNIGDSHLEKLKDRMGVYREKTSLLSFTNPEGAVVYNADDPYLRKLNRRVPGERRVTYSVNGNSDYSAENISTRRAGGSTFSLHGQRLSVSLPGRHNVYNALAAASVARLFKIGYQKIRRGLEECKSFDGRMKTHRVGPTVIIDDSYNANPTSFEAAVKTLNDFPTEGKRVLVCSDMLELGKAARQAHRESAQLINRSGINVILGTGPMTRSLITAVRSRNDRVARHCADIGELHRHLKRSCRRGDTILVKGSRRMKMERTVEFLKTTFLDN